MRFSGKVVAITGGANGIGRATARLLAREGGRVAILDIEEGPLNETAEAIRAAGGAVLPIAVDLTDKARTIAAFERIEAEWGAVDVLVNNVGHSARERASEFWVSEPEVWEFVVDLCLMTTLLCSRRVVPAMRQRGAGKIVNIASDSALVGDPGVADYAAAKAGIMGFTRSLARELAPFGVTVNAICPGATNTRGPQRLPPESVARVLAATPMGKMCEPEDIANGVAFLASEDARFVTGQALVINGGRIFH